MNNYFLENDCIERVGIKEGIVLTHERGLEISHFHLDCNTRPWLVVPEPEKVLRFVQITREAAGAECTGQHNAILQLVADRTMLAIPNQSIYIWHQPYNVCIKQNPQRWISMKDWLAEKGFAYVPSKDGCKINNGRFIMSDVKTVSDLQDELREHKDAAVALQVQGAIQVAISRELIREEDVLNGEAYNQIRMMIYELNKNPDPMDSVFQALIGKTENPVEAALQFIEKRMRIV